MVSKMSHFQDGTVFYFLCFNVLNHEFVMFICNHLVGVYIYNSGVLDESFFPVLKPKEFLLASHVDTSVRCTVAFRVQGTLLNPMDQSEQRLNPGKAWWLACAKEKPSKQRRISSCRRKKVTCSNPFSSLVYGPSGVAPTKNGSSWVPDNDS